MIRQQERYRQTSFLELQVNSYSIFNYILVGNYYADYDTIYSAYTFSLSKVYVCFYYPFYGMPICLIVNAASLSTGTKSFTGAKYSDGWYLSNPMAGEYDSTYNFLYVALFRSGWNYYGKISLATSGYPMKAIKLYVSGYPTTNPYSNLQHYYTRTDYTNQLRYTA